MILRLLYDKTVPGYWGIREEGLYSLHTFLWKKCVKLAEVGLDRVYTPTRVSGTTAIWTQWNKSREAKQGKKVR